MNPQEIADALRVPFAQEDIKKRPDGYDYIDQELITSRLLDATGGVFDVTINDGPKLVTYPKLKTGEAVSCWIAVVTLTIPGLGSRTNVGTAQALNEDAPKSAVTDAIKKCATLFGCGLQLYEKPSGNVRQSSAASGNAQDARPQSQTRTAVGGAMPINDTGVACPSCHAPNLKSHAKGCKAVMASV